MVLKLLEKFRRLKAIRPASQVPPGERVYAIGDVHGRLDLLTALMAAIDADDSARGPARSLVILLGDLIDRGPDSSGVLDAVRKWQGAREIRILCGNHEEMFLRSFEDTKTLRNLLLHGGRDTILSYPIDPQVFDATDLAEAQELMVRSIPLADRKFIESFEDYIIVGDYAFVHAGIRPGKNLEMQTGGDMRWIREPFLLYSGSHSHVVVHGHTITNDVEIKANRIGIDTGAYKSGRLNALGLEGDTRWLIEAQAHETEITTMTRLVD